jgi:hypothetical protein
MENPQVEVGSTVRIECQGHTVTGKVTSVYRSPTDGTLGIELEGGWYWKQWADGGVVLLIKEGEHGTED